jgi:N-acyl-D-aspartate/D-glutamate deacylase
MMVRTATKTLIAVGLLGCGQPAQQYDIVLAGGRVMDPESGTDQIRNVGITGDRIVAISEGTLDGKAVVDVTGHVVAPGFIDLHAHGQNLSDNKWQAQDGVTTALEMESGSWPVGEWYDRRSKDALLNYGITVGHVGSRIAHLAGARNGAEMLTARQTTGTSPAWSHQQLPVAEFDGLIGKIKEGLDQGALGIGMGINYTPAASQQEIYRVFELAAEYRVPIYVHVRGAGPAEPNGSLSSIQEMLADALTTGAPLHIVHLGSSGLGQGPKLATMIDAARAKGLDVTTEVYPYTAGSTFLQSAIFDPGWQDRIGISYPDLQWPATNERLTEATFAKYRKEGGWVIIHMIPEPTVDSLVAHPGIMIASDGVPIIDGRGHPRGVGTYARVLGRFVREKKLLTLMDALKKMSYLPAQRLVGAVPEMARKGRIKVGADADLVVFQPDQVIDRATFENPAQASAGIPHVLVNGTFVVRDGKVVDGVLPGRPIRRPASR